jgi:hypothetical protein
VQTADLKQLPACCFVSRWVLREITGNTKDYMEKFEVMSITKRGEKGKKGGQKQKSV